MTVVVSFVRPAGLFGAGGGATAGIGTVRIRENITIPGTTTAVAHSGEVIVIGNAEASMVAAACGTVPDADAVAATSATQAGVAIASGSVGVTLVPKQGDKVNIKVVA